MIFNNAQSNLGRYLVKALTATFCVLVIWFLKQWITNRLYFRRLQKRGLPMPPHSLIFGHLLVVAKVLRNVPEDAAQFYLSTLVRYAYPQLGPNFYLDVWPFAPALLVLGSPETWQQFTSSHGLEKTVMTKNFLYPLTKGLDLVSLEGAAWKKWRLMFNPGFSSAHLNSLVPWITQETQVYCRNLDQRAKEQSTFTMKPLTDNLALDIIGKVALGVHFQCQTIFSSVVHSLRTEIEWLSAGYEANLWTRYHPLRPFMLWYHGRIVDEYISKAIDEGFENWQQTKPSKRSSTILELALVTHATTLTNDESSGMTLDSHFKEMCMSQLKIFLLAGHDTTSSAICYCFWVLSQHPTSLERLRKEHNQVFGPDPTEASQQLNQRPQLLNQLPYTTAVIKESLRLFPPSTTMRKGQQGLSIVDARGRAFPTDKVSVWPNQQTTQRDSAYWLESNTFCPERWTVDSTDPMYPTDKELWRPFGIGPRSCIAQELAMMELKIVLVMVSRSYSFQPCYAEMDANSKKLNVLGEMAYQLEQMQPRGNLPVRVQKIETATVAPRIDGM